MIATSNQVKHVHDCPTCETAPFWACDGVTPCLGTRTLPCPSHAAACEPTCPHSDEQNMGGECEACYVKRTATPTITKDTDAVSIIYALALSDKVRWRVTLDGRVLDPRTGEAFGSVHQSNNGYAVETAPYAGWVAEREIEWVETCECPRNDHYHVRR